METSRAPLEYRRATLDDLADIQALVARAYSKYVDRIGRKPAPMVADYATLTTNARVTVAGDGVALMGMMVTEPREDHLHISNLAVDPMAQGQGSARRS